MSSEIRVRSEIAGLEAVVTSSPGLEFDLMVPENLESYRSRRDGGVERNPDYLLFDDLVLLSAMQAEHASLVDVIRAVTGSRNHHTWRDLLVQVLGDAAVRAEVIARTLALEDALYRPDARALDVARALLEALDAQRLADALITGRDPHDSHPVFSWPTPNALFARDLFAIVGDAAVMTYAAEPARGREMLLSRLILKHHRLFSHTPKLDIGDGGDPLPGLTIEGGDIQVLDARTVLIGVGIRTTLESVQKLAPMLFERGFEVVLGYEMPRQRAAMHIDTLFTRIDADRCLIYPPLVTDPARLGAQVHRFTPDGGHERLGPSLLAALSVHGIPLEPVFCGGNDPIHQTREQWSDGANAFALAPGVIITYGRNRRTLRQLNRVGYEVLPPERFVDNALFYIHHGHRIAIALHGHELVRGRGGPRCLTLPLRRKIV